MNRTAAALMVTAAIVSVGMRADATIVPPESNATEFHPHGTIGRHFLPDPCRVIARVPAEQHSQHGPYLRVREVVILRLKCSEGDRRRTVILHGPWFTA